jgi:hypothetical protein
VLSHAIVAEHKGWRTHAMHRPGWWGTRWGVQGELNVSAAGPHPASLSQCGGSLEHATTRVAKAAQRRADMNSNAKGGYLHPYQQSRKATLPDPTSSDVLTRSMGLAGGGSGHRDEAAGTESDAAAPREAVRQR